MLNVLFFAQTRELIGVDSIQLEDDLRQQKRYVIILLKKAIDGR